MNSKNILIVEDDLIAGEYLTELLIDSGFNVYPVIDNAKEALSFIKNKKPDLILMDIMIKGNISGCELSMMVRSFNKDVLIIFLTAYSEEEMIRYALNSKAYSYLLKPYRDIEIVSTVKMALETELIKKEKSDILFSKNDFIFYTKTSKLFHNEQEIFLSDKLICLIKVLMINRGSSVSFDEIAYAIWQNYDKYNLNTLRAIVHRLKSQLPELDLHTISKVGYVLY